MAYAAPVPSSPPVASANYANSAGSANTANYANTAGYANSSGLPAYSKWSAAIQSGSGYIYVYLYYPPSCSTSYPFFTEFSTYQGSYFQRNSIRCGGSGGSGYYNYGLYVFNNVLSNN